MDNYEKEFKKLEKLYDNVVIAMVKYNLQLHLLQQNVPDDVKHSTVWQEVKDLKPYQLNDSY